MTQIAAFKTFIMSGNVLSNVYGQEYIILGIYNGLLYLMKRQVNSSIVLQTKDFPHLHLDLINYFFLEPPTLIHLVYH
jgi:hypothetical protein